MSLFCWTQRKIFWRMWEAEQFWGTIDSHVFIFQLWKSMVPQNSLVTNFLQNIFFCRRQNKEIHTGLELGWVNDDRYFIFGWTIPLSRISSTHVKPIIMEIILLLFQLLFKIFSSFLSCIENDFILNNNNNEYYYWFFFNVWWESNLFLIFSNVSLFWGRSLTLTCPAQTSQSFSLFPVWDCCCCCIWTTEQDLLTSHTQHNCCYSVLCAV